MQSKFNKLDEANLTVDQLRESEERLRDFAEAGSDWFFEMDEELRFTYVSERHREIIGVLPEQVIGKTRWDAHENRRLPNEEENWQKHIAIMKAHESWQDFTYTLIRDDGQRRVISNSAKAIFDENGDFAGYRGVGRDVTDRASAETRLNSILDAVPDAIITIDENGLIASFSQAAKNIFGYSEQEVIGQNVKMLMPQPYRDEHDGYLNNYISTGEKKIIGIGREVEAIQKDGSVFPIHLTVSEMLIEGRRMFIGVVHDRTELNKAQSVSDHLGMILDQSLNEIYVFDAKTLQFVQANFGARKNMGYSSREFRRITPVDIKPEMTLAQFEELIKPLRDGSQGLLIFETIHQRKDGSTYPVEVHLQLMRSRIPPVFVAVLQDITIRRMQIETLKLRDRAIGAIDTGVLITDAIQDDNPIIYANHAMEKMSGYTIEEMLGRNPRFLQGDDRDQPGLDEIRNSIKDTVPVHVVLNNYHKDGARMISEVAISPIHNEEGKVTNFIGIQSDITEKINTEGRLRQSQKMEAIGQLTGGIAHDFNNLLTVVIGNNELLATRLNDDELSIELLDDATSAAESGAKLTSQLLSFARQQPLNPETIDLNSIIVELSDMLRRTLGEAITLNINLASDLGKSLADPTQVHNALLNLAINARDAMPNGGKLTLETTNITLDENTADKKLEVAPGEYIRVSVIDTGTGMSPEVQTRVMEPFYTTKVKGKGTGLGLSMVHGFAKQSGGHLEIYSELGHGTSMSFYLPVSEAIAKKNIGNSDASIKEHVEDKTVLVVEDDPRVRSISVKRLTHLGYKTIEAEAGQQALDILGDTDTVDIVFTDMVMPGGMTGTELLFEIKEKYPHIKRLITSGYAEDSTISNDDTLWLRKPYSIQDMADTFKQLLD